MGFNPDVDKAYEEKAEPLDPATSAPGVEAEDSYILHPQSMFIELIPLEHAASENPPTVFLDEVSFFGGRSVEKCCPYLLPLKG